MSMYPIDICSVFCSENDIASHPVVAIDFTTSYSEMNDYIRFLHTFRNCCLAEITICEAEPVTNLIQLGCDHFFHKGCLVPYLRHEIDKAISRQDTLQLMCFECKKTKHVCECMSCYERNDKNDLELQGHIYTEFEVQALVGDGGFTPGDKDKWDR